MNKQAVNPSCLFKRAFFLLAMLAAHSGLMAQCPGNPTTNPGFENGLTGWTNFGAGGTTNDAYSGSQALELCAAPGGDNRVLQGLPVTPGNNVEFKFFGKKSVNNEFFSGYVKYLTSSFQPIEPIEFEAITTMDFSEFSISSTAPSNAAYIEIGFVASANAATCAVVDEVCLTQGSTTPCNITASVSNITCDDNGTPNDPDDDTFGYQLLVTNGNQTGAFGIFNGGIQGASGTYGLPVTFSGALIIAAPFNPNSFIVRDAADPTCFTTYSIFPPPPCSNVQQICPGDITLSSQAEVDAWAGCTIVEGDLRIEGSDITDLSPLSTLQKVRGALFITENTSLVSIAGLENVDSVEALIILDNPLLPSIGQLGGLNQTEIASIVIGRNNSLGSINIFNSITFPNNVEIFENDDLIAIGGFSNAEIVADKILISNNGSLTGISAFQNLTEIQDQLLLVQNAAITDLSGFGELVSIESELVIVDSDDLENLDNFASLTNVGTLVILRNQSLGQINGLSSLTSVSQNLDIGDNPVLSNCCGIYPLLNSGGVAGTITIENNPMPCSNATDILDNCVPTGDIDLSIHLAQPNGSPAQWSSYEVVLTINNAGPQTATGVEVSFAKPAGVVYTGGNEFTASQGTFSAFSNEVWTVGSIPAGGTATLTTNYFLLAEEAPVAYAQVSAANETDADSTPSNGTPPSVNEDDEANTDGGTTPLPDLTLANLGIQNSPIEAGQVLNYDFDISNQGIGAASGNFVVRAYISTDNTISADDIQDGVVPTGNYGPGLTVADVVGASTIPAGLADGQYFLLLEVDADGQISESNEGNNVISAPFTIGDGGGGGPTGSCSFTTFYPPLGLELLDYPFRPDFDFQETPDGYVVSQEFVNYVPSFPAPPTFDTYELDREGNVVSAFGTPIVPTIDVAVQTTSDENLEMVFNLSPDLPAGTIVTIDLDYPTPPADVLVSSQAVRTSSGYAFGVGIVDPTTSQLIFNRIYQTDHVGQNVTFADLPESAFFYGTSVILEGPDGSIFSEWQTSGNYSLFVVPGDGSAPWQVRVASDTPSSTWIETEVSADGQFVYTMKDDNARVFVAKYDVSTGAELGIDLVDLNTSPLPTGFRFTFGQGIEPTSDGGLLVSLRTSESSGSPVDSYQVLAKYDAAGSLVWKTEIPDADFELTPVGETSDGGALFAGSTSTENVFLKTAGNGALMPECDGGTGSGDIDLSLEMTTSNPSPSIYSSTEVTVEITNAGPQTATGIVVDFPRPASIVYTGGNEWGATQGTFNPFGNEKWEVGSLASGETASLTVSYFLLTANALTPYAQVEAANETDGDSTPGNGTCCTPNEDDEVTLTLNSFSGGGTIALGKRNLVGRAIQLMAVNPNPVYHGKITVVIDSQEEGVFDLEAFDLFGRRAFLQKVELHEGRNDLHLDVSDLRSGTYLLNMPGQNWRNMPVRFVVARW